MQYLYDPITGDGPLPPVPGTSGASRLSSSSIETNGEKGKAGDQNTVLRKKKTPTQLRRERKKRQKERERRQREMEKRSEAQAKQQTEGKTSKDLMEPETETKEWRQDGRKESDYKQQQIPQPTSAAASTASGNGDDNNDEATEGHQAQQGESLMDELSSSDSEHHPESSNNSHSQSPAHSSYSPAKSLENDNEPEEDLLEQQDALVKLPGATSTADEPAQEEQVSDHEDSLQDDNPSTDTIVESGSEVTVNHKAGHSVTMTTTHELFLTTYDKGDTKLDHGLQNGAVELELKPEE